MWVVQSYCITETFRSKLYKEVYANRIIQAENSVGKFLQLVICELLNISQ